MGKSAIFGYDFGDFRLDARSKNRSEFACFPGRPRNVSLQPLLLLRESLAFVLHLSVKKSAFGVYLVSVSGGYQADLRGTDRPNRNSAKSRIYIQIGSILSFL